MASNYTIAARPAIARERKTKNWVEVSISDINISRLFELYRPIYIPLDDLFGKELTLNLYDYETQIARKDYPVSEWLTLIGDVALTVSDGYPELNIGKVHYVPATYHIGTSLKMAKRDYDPSHDVAVEDMDDLIISLPDIDPYHLAKNVLFSVDGLFVPAKYQDYGARLLNAGEMIRFGKKIELGMLNFEDVGQVDVEPITADMVDKIDPGKTWFDRLIVRTKQDVTNKTVGVVIGGYLHLLDGTVNVQGPNTVTLSLGNYDFLERINQTKDILDLSFMEMDNLDTIGYVNQFLTEDNAHKYLTSKYSFLVIIDNPNLMRESNGIMNVGKLGTYLIPEQHHLGWLTDQYGRGLEYWPKYECGMWALSTSRFEYQSWMAETVGWEKLIAFNDAAEPYTPHEEVAPEMVTFYAKV